MVKRHPNDMELDTTGTAVDAKYAAAALFIGTALNMTRMAPIFLSERFSFAEFPPAGPEQAAAAALLGGWYPSHVMAMLSVPFLVYGLHGAYRHASGQRDNIATSVIRLGFVGFATALSLYMVAAVLDGVALTSAAEHYDATSGSQQELAGALVMLIHETAIGFGGHFMAASIISVGVFGTGLLMSGRASGLAKAGAAGGAIGVAGLVSGVLDLSFQQRFPLLGGVMGAVMVWWIALGVATLRRGQQTADSV